MPPRRPGSKKRAPKVPTPAQARKLPEIDQFVAREEQENVSRVVFKSSDIVFVVHDDMDINNRPSDGHSYYMMAIQSIRQGKDMIWAVGTWYYRPEDLSSVGLSPHDKKLIPLMGNTEVVHSDHIGVIDALCIEAHVNLHHFNDTGSTGSMITSKSWFTRLSLITAGANPVLTGVNFHCNCEKMYSPVLDYQHFCHKCIRWFHANCLNKVGRPAVITGATATACLKAVPTMRGWNNMVDDQERPWMVVGTGYFRQQVLRHEDQIEVVGKDIEDQWSEWSEFLGEEYINYVRHERFKHFSCPECKSLI